MDAPLDQSRFQEVLLSSTDAERGTNYLSYIEDQIRHGSWQDFHDDIFTIPETARRLFLPLCFDISVRGDGMNGAFSFYGHSGDSLIREIMDGFRLLEMPQVAELIDTALKYWRDPNSPMHSDSVPWMRMDQDLDDVHGRYYKQTTGLGSIVGALIEKLGEERIHRFEQ